VDVQDAAKVLVLTQDGLQGLTGVLKNAGHIVVGPRVVGSDVVVDEIQRTFPAGGGMNRPVVTTGCARPPRSRCLDSPPRR
jgi:hypothetical protein